MYYSLDFDILNGRLKSLPFPQGRTAYDPDGIGTFTDKYNYRYDNYEEPIMEPYFLQYKTKFILPDFASGDYCVRSVYTSNKALELLHQMKTGIFKRYPLEYTRRGKLFQDYSLNFFYKDEDKLVDYSKTTFKVIGFFNKEVIFEGLIFNDLASVKKYWEELQKNWDYKSKGFMRLISDQIYLKEDAQEYDLFTLNVSGNFYCSHRFKDAYEALKLTGVYRFVSAENTLFFS